MKLKIWLETVLIEVSIYKINYDKNLVVCAFIHSLVYGCSDLQRCYHAANKIITPDILYTWDVMIKNMLLTITSDSKQKCIESKNHTIVLLRFR